MSLLQFVIGLHFGQAARDKTVADGQIFASFAERLGHDAAELSQIVLVAFLPDGRHVRGLFCPAG